MDKLCAEVDAVVRGRVPTAADLTALPYLTACFNESLRCGLRARVGALGHRCRVRRAAHPGLAHALPSPSLL